MSQKPYRIFISKTFFEKRIAFCTEQNVEEVWIDRGHPEKHIVGNIYYGKVQRVLPGMQASFVDIELEKNGFLYEGDIIETEEDGLDYLDSSPESGAAPHVPSFQSLKPKDRILVQVTKGPIASKGARLTTSITLTGKFLVLLPQSRRIGISKKIKNSKTRDQLFQAIKEVQKNQGFPYGIIIRTAALNTHPKKLQEEYLNLIETWLKVAKAAQKAKAPCLLHSDNDPLDRLLREYCGNPATQIIVDHETTYKRLLSKAQARYFFPKENIILYNKGGGLFEDFGIEQELSKTLDRRIWLESGGYIVFDETEALTVIDVNTGRFVGKTRLEETLVKTNIEAAEEIVQQITLRNLSGIIIVDFIDMDENKHKHLILDTLKKKLKNDRTRNSVLSMTQLGLVQITRKRTHSSLLHQLSTTCPYCDGKGVTKGEETVLLEILREIKSHIQKKNNRLSVLVSEPLFEAVLTTYKLFIEDIEKKHRLKITWKMMSDFHLEEFEVYV